MCLNFLSLRIFQTGFLYWSTGGVCAYWGVKWRLHLDVRLEACEFWQQQESSFSPTCRPATTEQIQCPNGRSGAGKYVRWKIIAGWTRTVQQQRGEVVSNSSGIFSAMGDGGSLLLLWGSRTAGKRWDPPDQVRVTPLCQQAGHPGEESFKIGAMREEQQKVRKWWTGLVRKGYINRGLAWLYSDVWSLKFLQVNLCIFQMMPNLF